VTRTCVPCSCTALDQSYTERESKADRRSLWIADKQRRLGTNRACVAVANKNARIIWAMLANEQRYLRLN
jgi:transposase